MFIDENNQDTNNSKRDDKPKDNLQKSKAQNTFQSENSIQNPTEVIKEPSQKETPLMSGVIPINPVERYIENQKNKDKSVKIQYMDRLVGTMRSSYRNKIPIKMEFGIYLGLIIISGFMRLWELGSRAMHHDESLHALYSWYLYVGNGYQHLPMMHGPFQYHGNFLKFFLFGDSDYSARLMYAIFGIVLIVIPLLLRYKIGQFGAMSISILLAISPSLLYFSRFARNDILMAVWTLSLVVVMWKYIDEKKTFYLYIFAALLALIFTTKETSFIVVAIFGSFMLSMVAPEFLACFRRQKSLSNLSPMGVLVLLFMTLTLPQWSAGISLFGNLFNIVLANHDPSLGPVGMPLGTGVLISQIIVVLLLALSIICGIRWNIKIWLGCAALFYFIWVFFYTTFFTNIAGIESGIWESLGYWIVQQDVQRGGQPWYYYFVITPIYEFLPLILSIGASVYYLNKRDLFGTFLIYWAVLSFLFYTVAGEKMPWLLVNICLPIIILGGSFLGRVLQNIQWGESLKNGGFLVPPILLLLIIFIWQIAFFDFSPTNSSPIYIFILLVGIALILIGGIIFIYKRTPEKNNIQGILLLSCTIFFILITFRTGVMAAYHNGDNPVEMLVYTQTSPDIPRITKQINEISEITGEREKLKITIDATDGYTWPWAWYLRNFQAVNYPCYGNEPGCNLPTEAPDSSVVVIHANNSESVQQFLDNDFGEGTRIKHRWWFPETYRELTVAKTLDNLVNRSKWKQAVDYMIYRKFVTPIGSIDGYVYFSKDVPIPRALDR